MLAALCLMLVSLAVPAPAAQGVPVTAFPLESGSSLESANPAREEVLAGRVRAGKAFTQKQKQIVKQKNAQENDGKNRCENCETETVPAKKHEKGVTPPLNETQIDHKIPRVKGGPGEVDNAQVLCRDCNLKKGSKDPGQEQAP
jgi:5-methylcytosine-specific restriction endonuclease McrA